MVESHNLRHAHRGSLESLIAAKALGSDQRLPAQVLTALLQLYPVALAVEVLLAVVVPGGSTVDKAEDSQEFRTFGTDSKPIPQLSELETDNRPVIVERLPVAFPPAKSLACDRAGYRAPPL